MFCQQTPASYVGQAETVASRAQSALPQGAHIVLYTGHSLGGALAGLQAGAGRGCAVGFNSPSLSALTQATVNMITCRIDTDMVSLPYDPSSDIWQRVNSITSLLNLGCNDQKHLGPVHTMPLPRSFSFGRLMRDAFTVGAGAVLTPFSPSAPEWTQFIRDALASHGIDTIRSAVHTNTQATEKSWWCRNVGFGC